MPSLEFVDMGQNKNQTFPQQYFKAFKVLRKNCFKSRTFYSQSQIHSTVTHRIKMLSDWSPSWEAVEEWLGAVGAEREVG
jgi:hypothetical protein